MIGPGPRSCGGMWTVASTLVRAVEPHADVRFIETTDVPDASKMAKFGRALAGSLQFATALILWRPEVVHVHFASGASIQRKVPFLLFARWMRRPVLAHLHGGGFGDYVRSGPRRGVARARNVLRGVDLLVAVDGRGVRLLQEWLDLPDDRFVTIPNCARAPIGTPTRSRGADARFAFIGRLSSEKGVDVLLEAWKLAVRRNPGSTLELAGEGPLRERALLLAAEDSSIAVLGQLDAGSRDELLLRADALVLPSLVENVPMVVLEAMAAGLPVVATAVGGVPDLIDDGSSGLLVEPGDVQALAHAMSALAADPELRTGMGARAREYAARCDVEAVGARLLEVYKSIARTPGGEGTRR